MIKHFSLQEIEDDFEQTKRSLLSDNRKDVRYATMMTILERNFNIRIFGNNTGNPALLLYKEISRERKF